jgi:hypothetical protein
LYYFSHLPIKDKTSFYRKYAVFYGGQPIGKSTLPMQQQCYPTLIGSVISVSVQPVPIHWFPGIPANVILWTLFSVP